jgi:hypothetical protein
MLWRAWHVHNTITYDAGNIPIAESVGFLLSYWECLSKQSEIPWCLDSKGQQLASSVSDQAPPRRQGDLKRLVAGHGDHHHLAGPRLILMVLLCCKQVKPE